MCNAINATLSVLQGLASFFLLEACAGGHISGSMPLLAAALAKWFSYWPLVLGDHLATCALALAMSPLWRWPARWIHLFIHPWLSLPGGGAFLGPAFSLGVGSLALSLGGITWGTCGLGSMALAGMASIDWAALRLAGMASMAWAALGSMALAFMALAGMPLLVATMGLSGGGARAMALPAGGGLLVLPSGGGWVALPAGAAMLALAAGAATVALGGGAGLVVKPPSGSKTFWSALSKASLSSAGLEGLLALEVEAASSATGSW